MATKKADSDRRLFIACGVLALVNILVTHYWPSPWGSDVRLKRPLEEYHPPTPGPPPNITYRNHFADIGVSNEDVQARVKHMMDMYLYGDLKEERLYFPAGKDLIQVVDVGKDQVHSEAMSYGMMVAVQLDHKDVFDKMWKWTRTYMINKEGPNEGFMAWLCTKQGQIKDTVPAPDADEYIAAALIFASKRWGNGKGVLNYAQEANNLLHRMLHQDQITGGYPFFNKKSHLLVFSTRADEQHFTNPSYHLPGFYEVYARFVSNPRDQEFFRQAAASSRDFLHKAAHPETALWPDYCLLSGKACPTPQQYHVDHRNFSFDAWRTMMNVAFDYHWWKSDPRQPALSERYQAFFASQGIRNYCSVYTVDGGCVTPYDHGKGLMAMNACASMISSGPDEVRQEFLKELWNIQVPTGKWRYYDGMLMLMSLLHLSGNFRVYI